MQLLLVWLATSPPAYADCGDTGFNDTSVEVRNEDCDQDGYRKVDGDCNDENAAVNPGQVELCETDDDDDCDGFFSEECDAEFRRGTMIGGSTCGSTGAAAWLLLLPLLGLKWRRA